MKKTFLFIFLVFTGTAGFSQFVNFITFDDSVNLLRIRIDTSLSGNLWQIGQPAKNVFISAHSVPNAIVTDLHNPYPVNNTSVFYLVTPGDFPFKYHAAHINFYTTDRLTF
jgi:hypothetical protein